MIEFHYESDCLLNDETQFTDWLSRVISSEGKFDYRLTYIFCNDSYLLKMNQKYLQHDTYTDVITFDYSHGNKIIGDIFISIERVNENAINYEADSMDELRRVMVHGLLHLLGYGDKSNEEKAQMRLKENEKLKLFHVEQ